LSTIAVGQTLTIDLESVAVALLADIVDGARITVIAIVLIELCSTPAGTVTYIISAWIGIVADHGEPDAGSGLTMVSHCARVAVHAFTFRQVGICTTALSLA
jgi:hypothetical protein